MKTAKLLELLGEAGFTGEMAEAMIKHFAQKPHTHTSAEITDFDVKVVEVIEESELAYDDEEDD